MSESIQKSDKLVGIELTSTAFKAVCLDETGKIADSCDGQMVRGNDTAPQLTAFVESLKSRFGAFESFGLAIPGLIDHASRRIAFSTSFPEHQNTAFFDEIEQSTGLRIVVENDANAAAIGEYTLGAARGSKSLFYVTLGAGVGGALVIDGNVWHGRHGFAGEFGYLAIDDDGRRLEDVASATSIVRRTRSRFRQDNTSSLDDLGEFTVADVVREAREGDDFSHLMLERTGRHVGTALAGVINLLNIEAVVLGGAVMEGDDTVLNAIIARARELSFGPSFESTRIAVGELGRQAAAIGAALLSRAG